MKNVLVTGSLGYDYIMDFSGRFADRIMPDKIHKISLSFLADKLNKQFGGTAGNIAYTLHLLGTHPLILSYGGNDFAPYQEFLTNSGINIDHIPLAKDVSTSTYFVITDLDDNQIGSFYVGAMKYNSKLSIANHSRNQRSSDSGKDESFVIISPNDPSAMVKYVTECNQSQLRYLYDPAFQIATFTPEQLKHGIVGADIVIGNDYEVSLMEQKLNISHEELILDAGILVTTLAGKGSVIESRKDSIHIKPSKAKNVSDPTGAGDAYRAGFISGYLSGTDLTTCGRMGSVAAVYTVEKYGTVTHKFSKKQFRDRYYENYGEKLNY